jgi:hypothetical protein
MIQKDGLLQDIYYLMWEKNNILQENEPAFKI